MRLEDLYSHIDGLVNLKSGETVFKQGEPGDKMFILYQGVVDIYVGEKHVGSFEPVEVLGEMAVIDPQPRSASVICKTDCQLASINQKRFVLLVQNKPEFGLHIMKMLVERIRWMDESARSHESKDGELIQKLEGRIKELTGTVEAQKNQLQEIKDQLKSHQAPAPGSSSENPAQA